MIMRVVGIFVSSTLPILIIMIPKFLMISVKLITGKELWDAAMKTSIKSDRDSKNSKIEAASGVVVKRGSESNLAASVSAVFVLAGGGEAPADAHSDHVAIKVRVVFPHLSLSQFALLSNFHPHEPSSLSQGIVPMDGDGSATPQSEQKA